MQRLTFRHTDAEYLGKHQNSAESCEPIYAADEWSKLALISVINRLAQYEDLMERHGVGDMEVLENRLGCVRTKRKKKPQMKKGQTNV